MMPIFVSITLMIWCAAGFAFILGARRLGIELTRTATLISLTLGLTTLLMQCRQPLLANLLLLLLVLVFTGPNLWRFRGVFTFPARGVFLLVKILLLFHFRIGMWLTERILLRFPIAFLVTSPGDILGTVLRGVIVADSIALGLSFTAGLGNLVLWWTLGDGLFTKPSEFLCLALPLVLIITLGNLGKWRYRRREAKGLAHV